MKKLTTIFIIVFILISGLMASNARLQTLGSEAAMLVDDDVSIDLFPQRINDFSIARVEGLGMAQPGYLVIIGDKGDKWGAFGSSSNSEDLVNIYRSLSPSSAVKLSFRIFREKNIQENNNANNERSIGGFNASATYGWDNITSEQALSLGISYGPGASYNGLEFSNFDYVTYGVLDTNTVSGSSHTFNINANYSNRTSFNLAIFNKRYDHVGIGFGTGGHEITDNNTKIREGNISDININARTFLFNQQQVNQVSKLYYGVGAGLGYMRNKAENDISGVETINNDFYFGSLRLATGLEINIKNIDIRIGLNRTNTLYRTSGSKTENATTTEQSTSYISTNAGYGINTGLGYFYKGFQFNVVLNDQIWRSGPQMIFDSGNGNIFLAFDIVYNF